MAKTWPNTSTHTYFSAEDWHNYICDAEVEQKLPQLSGEVFTLEENDDGDKVAAERDEGCQRVDDDDGHVPGVGQRLQLRRVALSVHFQYAQCLPTDRAVLAVYDF